MVAKEGRVKARTKEAKVVVIMAAVVAETVVAAGAVPAGEGVAPVGAGEVQAGRRAGGVPADAAIAVTGTARKIMIERALASSVSEKRAPVSSARERAVLTCPSEPPAAVWNAPLRRAGVQALRNAKAEEAPPLSANEKGAQPQSVNAEGAPHQTKSVRRSVPGVAAAGVDRATLVLLGTPRLLGYISVRHQGDHPGCVFTFLLS